MVQLTRIYTRGGDKGQTSLGDGRRVSSGVPQHSRIVTVMPVPPSPYRQHTSTCQCRSE